MGKKARQHSDKRIDWDEAIADVPTRDWINLSDVDTPGRLAEVIESFIFFMEGHDYLVWEAVIRDEQGLPLSQAQESILDELIDFSDDDDDILYINERERPTEPWFGSLRRLAAKLVVPAFDTTKPLWEWMTDGWPRLADVVDIHATNLEVPEGVKSPSDVVPPEIRHRLWIQNALVCLGGLGEYCLASDEDGQEQIREFVSALRDCKESVEYLNLTLDSLLTILKLPTAEEPLFVEQFKSETGVSSPYEKIASQL